MASIAYFLATTSGARWIDIMRLRWEDLSFFTTPLTKGIQASMRMSKNNLCNTAPQVLTWTGKNNIGPENNPVAALKRWWRYCGQPRSGYIIGIPNKTPEQVGKSTIYFVQQYARTLNLPIPTKHSARVSMCVTLYELGTEPGQIDRAMNWKTDRMQKHYLNKRNLRSLNAPAHKLALLSDNDLNRMQKHLR